MTKRTFFPVALAAILLILFAVTMFFAPASTPTAHAFAPTPVSVDQGRTAKAVTLLNTSIVTSAATGGAPFVVENSDKVDLQVVIDQGTTNTVTMKLQFSNNGADWVDGATVATAVAADSNTMQQYAVFGRYARIHYDAANTNTLPVEVYGLFK